MCVEASARRVPRGLANQDHVDDAQTVAVQNAALEGIYVAADEPALIRLHQSGEIDNVEFQSGVGRQPRWASPVRRTIADVTSGPAAAQQLRDLARLRRVRDRIDREYAQPLDVEALARGVNMSAGHLSREFRRAYGESPYSYLMTRRIERAMALLRRGDLSVTEVCFAVGCSSLGTFSTRFTELVGVPPSTYRGQTDARRRGCRRAWRSR